MTHSQVNTFSHFGTTQVIVSNDLILTKHCFSSCPFKRGTVYPKATYNKYNNNSLLICCVAMAMPFDRTTNLVQIEIFVHILNGITHHLVKSFTVFRGYTLSTWRIAWLFITNRSKVSLNQRNILTSRWLDKLFCTDIGRHTGKPNEIRFYFRLFGMIFGTVTFMSPTK